MVFKHIEECVLEQDQTDNYSLVLDQTKWPTKLVLPLALDIASYLKKLGLENDYVLFGGYAVLSHLMSVGGEDVAHSWRGSEDIDMAGTQRVINALKTEYEIIGDKPSPNIKDKRTIRLLVEPGVGNKEECKIDFYNGDYETRFSPTETNTHFGCELKVSNPLCLIRSKLHTPEDEAVHSEDMTRLLSVLEYREYSPESVAKFFNSEEKAKLLRRFRQGYESIGADGLDSDLIPSFNYKKQLGRELSRGNSVSYK
jgi:hypothetical protein